MKRPRTDSGLRTHLETAVPVRSSLIYAVLGAPQPRERKPLRVFHGPKPPAGSPAPKLSDAEVLHIRALHKFVCMSAADIAVRTGHDINAVKLQLSFKNRVHLEPEPRHIAQVAQSEEQPLCMAQVAGSMPARGPIAGA